MEELYSQEYGIQLIQMIKFYPSICDLITDNYLQIINTGVCFKDSQLYQIMIQVNRNCKIKGHREYPLIHICTLSDCNQTTRWCCQECIKNLIHHHSKPNNFHIMNMNETLNKITNEYLIFKKDYVQKHKKSESTLLLNILNQFQKMEKSLIENRNYVEKLLQRITSDEDLDTYEQYLSYVNDNNFEYLDDDKINQLLNINSNKFNQQTKQYLQQSLDDLKQQFLQIESFIRDYQAEKNYNSNSVIDFKNRKYIIENIDNSNEDYGSQLSKNEQYLAYGAYNEYQLKVFDLKQQKIIKLFELDSANFAFQFTQDSSQLYIGQGEGNIYGYDVYDDFKEIYQHKVHSSYIYSILTIKNNYLITCSADKSIIKTDIKNKQQIFKFIGHTNDIYAIDYNDKNEILISGSCDQSIKLWNCMDQGIIINKLQSHNNNIMQIQFINNNLNIMSLDNDGIIYKWKIDLINKDLIKLQQYSDKNKIINFYQVNQNQNLLLVCNQYVKILNCQGETELTIEHGGQASTYLDCRQLDNLKYIQIRANKKIILAIAQD